MGAEAQPFLRCNIGAAELRRRRWIAVVLTIASIALAALLVASGIPHLFRIALWPLTAGAAVTWLQVARRFCVRFGLTGVENFGPLGEERQVAPEQLEVDQRRARELIGEGILAGLLAAVAFVNLPL
ncbi:MAG TPA: hypothetical protein VGI98_06440 [Candidatus Limnocylindrales bacterium]|jgi:hypothetical protein